MYGKASIQIVITYVCMYALIMYVWMYVCRTRRPITVDRPAIPGKCFTETIAWLWESSAWTRRRSASWALPAILRWVYVCMYCMYVCVQDLKYMYVFMYVCMYVGMNECKFVFSMYMWKNLYLFIYLYVCMYVYGMLLCMYVCMYLYSDWW